MFRSGLPLAFVLALVSCAPERGTIGALLARTPDGQLVVRDAPPELGSARAGVEPGDRVLLIDGRDVRELDERGIHRALSGEVDEPVRLTLVRGEDVVRVTVKRTVIPRRTEKKQ